MRIKNWTEFQHFKDRRPPWIKLHREILEQRDISAISDCSFRVLIGIWLLASEDEAMCGNIPSVEDIAFRLRIDKAKIIKALKELDPFLIQDDIEVISGGYQDDAPETEERQRKEAETEAETEADKRDIVSHLCEFDIFWAEYPNKKAKEAARKAWKKIKIDKQLIIGDIVDRNNWDADWKKDGGKFIPHPATYLNNKRWEDEWKSNSSSKEIDDWINEGTEGDIIDVN